MNANKTLVTDQWTHLAGTYDGATMKIYIDGVLSGSSTARSGNLKYSDGPNPPEILTFGCYYDLDEEFEMNGAMNSVEIYDRALAANEILGASASVYPVPTIAPVPAPTSVPAPEPTITAPTGAICFTGDSLLTLQNGSSVKFSDLEVRIDR